MDALLPMNAKYEQLSDVIEYLQQAKDSNLAVDQVKEQIKISNSGLYQSLWFEVMTSLDEMVTALNQQQLVLDQSRKVITDRAKTKLDSLVAKNTKEAREKDKSVKELLGFLHAIGLDVINQSKLNTIIDQININPQHYGLQQAINFED